MEELRRVALELLDEWNELCIEGIHEFSGTIDAHLAEQAQDYEHRRRHIVNIT
ncbi:hypothetical protein MKY59_21405 [Paenibacillus sp. FSL W8-0426]|uniref:hypothetical protein n=1 Tax=Paenibacillus sp. FSL W8-0426 TaxID=2921714 RepID=UPI0030D8ABDD